MQGTKGIVIKIKVKYSINYIPVIISSFYLQYANEINYIITIYFTLFKNKLIYMFSLNISF